MAAKLISTTKTKSLRVPYGLAVHDDRELRRVTRVIKEHRTIMGPETKDFEEHIADLFKKKYGVMVNSGSSANLLAFEILNLPPGSEVITPVLTFSTTVMPLIKKGLVPVFVDVEPGTYVVNISEIEKKITKNTRALMVPLLLGNVPDMERLANISKKHNLFLVEDSCDTLAATFDGKPTGIYTDISTTSFYGSHIITAGGNGGMILMNSKDWRDHAIVLRGWGRSSSLFSESEQISKRFGSELDGIPYDAKFIFDEVGYNFMPSEIGAAFGNVQLKKLPKFKKTREKNFQTLHSFFKTYETHFILPFQHAKVRTQWLAFPLTIRKSAPFTRLEIVKFLEKNNIQTRPIFTGNILRQPGFRDVLKPNGELFPIADEIMERGFVVGCHHGLEKKHIEKIKSVFETFLKRYQK